MGRRFAVADKFRLGSLVVAALGVVGSVGASWLLRVRCLRDGRWQDGEQYTALCYTDLNIFWYQRGLGQGATPYFDAALEYPVLIGAQLWGVAIITRALPDPDVASFLTIGSVVAAGWALGVLALLRTDRHGADGLYWWALSPQLVLYAVLNVDLPAIFWAIAALVAHDRNRPGLAGVATGLGAATKLIPAVFAPALLLDSWRQRRWSGLLRYGGGALGAWLIVNLPVMVVAPGRWDDFYHMSSERGASAASVWTAVARVADVTIDGTVMNVASAVALSAAALGVLTIRPMPANVAALGLVVAFLLSSKVYSPQFSLWVIPLALLAGVDRRALAFFSATDVAVFVLEFLYLGGRRGYEPSVPYVALGLAVAARAVALVWLVHSAMSRRNRQV